MITQDAVIGNGQTENEHEEKTEAQPFPSFSAKGVAAALDDRKLDVLPHLLPAGRVQGKEYLCGALNGEAGASLKIHINGKGTVWSDFATGEKGGDLLDLWAAVRCGGDLRVAMREAADWLGLARSGQQSTRAMASANHEVNQAGPHHQQKNLGQETERWTYRDTGGKPWIDIVRYDPPDGKKMFRQYDHRAKCWTGTSGYELPKPRPLYNLHLLSGAEHILFVEGEKCAQMLTEMGFVATTTMQGANSPHLSDFAPLRGKTVTVWPDKDIAGKGYADKVEKFLQTVEATARRILVPSEKPEGWDAADAIGSEGWTKENVQKLLDTAQPSQARIFRPYTIEEFLSLNLAPREKLIDPWLTAQGLAMVHAWRGVGKTYFSLGAAFAVATGEKFLAWKVPQPRKVLYIDGEMPAGLLQLRLAEMVGGASQEPPNQEYFKLLPADLFLEGIPDLSSEAGQKAIEPFLDGIELLVLDNLSTLVRSGEENAAEAWLPLQEWGLSLRRRGMAVLLVHHSGKGGLQRGSSKREDTLDTVINLRQPADYQHDQGCRFEIHFEKTRGFFGAGAEPIDVQYSTKDKEGSPCTWTFRKTAAALTDKVADLHGLGLSYNDIGKELGISKSTVCRHLKGTGHADR